MVSRLEDLSSWEGLFDQAMISSLEGLFDQILVDVSILQGRFDQILISNFKIFSTKSWFQV